MDLHFPQAATPTWKEDLDQEFSGFVDLRLPHTASPILEGELGHDFRFFDLSFDEVDSTGCSGDRHLLDRFGLDFALLARNC